MTRLFVIGLNCTTFNNKLNFCPFTLLSVCERDNHKLMQMKWENMTRILKKSPPQIVEPNGLGLIDWTQKSIR